MRLLLFGDLQATGFGQVTMNLGKALIDAGADVQFVAFIDEAPENVPEWIAGRLVPIEREPGWLTFEERRAAQERMEARLRGLFTSEMYDAALLLGDPASIIRSGIAALIPDGFPAYHYVPIEGVGLPPSWRAIWERLRPIAMCRFGARELGSLLGTEPPFVYHGVDTDTFHPASPRNPIVWRGEQELVITSRADAKRALGIDPKVTVILRMDRFMPRKRYPALLRSMAPVLAKHPDAVLLCHMRMVDEGGNFDDFRSHYPPAIAARMELFRASDGTPLWDKYGPMPLEVLATMYNAGDIYVSNGAEGFGLTIAEAAACGLPIVGLDFSSVPEVIGPAGLLVQKGRPVENIYSYYWAEADERAFGEAVDELITNKTLRWKLAALGPGHAARNFTWSAAAASFLAIMDTRVEAVA